MTEIIKKSNGHAIAVDGKECLFVAVVLPGEATEETTVRKTISASTANAGLVSEKFIKCVEDENGSLVSIDFENEDKFNFAFDIVDAIAKKNPEKLAELDFLPDEL